MKLIRNSGTERVIDELRNCLAEQSALSIASPSFSLFAFGELHMLLSSITECRLIIPDGESSDLSLLGGASDRRARNALQIRWLAKNCIDWAEKKLQLRHIPATLPQSTIIASNPDGTNDRVIIGSCPFTTTGLGLILLT